MTTATNGECEELQQQQQQNENQAAVVGYGSVCSSERAVKDHHHNNSSNRKDPPRVYPSHISIEEELKAEEQRRSNRQLAARAAASGGNHSESKLLLDRDGRRKNSFDLDDTTAGDDAITEAEDMEDRISIVIMGRRIGSLPITLRQIALQLSLWVNVTITVAKLIAYLQTFSLSVLAALLDSVLDTVSQLVLGYTEKHSSKERSSAFYPAGASRLEAIGVLGIAALMGMASFEVLKDSIIALAMNKSAFVAHTSSSSSNSIAGASDGGMDGGAGEDESRSLSSFWSMFAIVFVKIALLMLCNRAANKRAAYRTINSTAGGAVVPTAAMDDTSVGASTLDIDTGLTVEDVTTTKAAVVQLADPTLEALAQDHFNDALSNSVAATALLFALQEPKLWFLDPVGAIIISLYIIYSWYMTGKEQIEQLIGKSAPDDFIDEITEMARVFDERIEKVDVVRAYHFGPKFLVEIEIVMPKSTLLFESHDIGMELQYEIEAREEVERCFVHIDYEQRPYDEHVVSKVPELREKYRPKAKGFARSTRSV